jgi:hypothetical protein
MPAVLNSRKRGKSKFALRATAASHLLFSLHERPMLLFGLVGVYLWTMLDRNVKAYSKAAGTAAFIWRLTLTTGTGSLFGFLIARELYGTAMLAPMFIIMSFAYGLAIYLMVLAAAYAWTGRPLGDAVMMRQKELGIWRAYSWNEVSSIVAEIGAGLASVGFEPGEVASVLSNTCREWVWCDLAIQSVGGVCNGIYPTDAAQQVEYLCTDSRSVVLFVEDDEQLDKYLEVAEALP